MATINSIEERPARLRSRNWWLIDGTAVILSSCRTRARKDWKATIAVQLTWLHLCPYLLIQKCKKIIKSRRSSCMAKTSNTSKSMILRGLLREMICWSLYLKMTPRRSWKRPRSSKTQRSYKKCSSRIGKPTGWRMWSITARCQRLTIDSGKLLAQPTTLASTSEEKLLQVELAHCLVRRRFSTRTQQSSLWPLPAQKRH